jgi:hypothetical protein
MKILITTEPKGRLQVGKHHVKIVRIDHGITDNGYEYFDCHFENHHGVCESRIYVTERSMNRIISLFKACHLSAEINETVFTDDLIGKNIMIENAFSVREGDQFIETVAFVGYKQYEEEVFLGCFE